MTLRAKLVVALAVLAAAATIAIGFFSYSATANQLNAQINQSLDATASSAVIQLARADPDFGRYPSGHSIYQDSFPNAPLGQFINSQQPVVNDAADQGMSLPVNSHDQQIAG